jgi:hypothetical protein
MGNWVCCTEKKGGGPVHLNTSYIAGAEWNDTEKATVITFKVGRNDTNKVKEPPVQILGDKYG